MLTNVKTTYSEAMIRKQQLQRWNDFDGLPFEATTIHNKFMFYTVLTNYNLLTLATILASCISRHYSTQVILLIPYNQTVQ